MSASRNLDEVATCIPDVCTAMLFAGLYTVDQIAPDITKCVPCHTHQNSMHIWGEKINCFERQCLLLQRMCLPSCDVTLWSFGVFFRRSLEKQSSGLLQLDCSNSPDRVDVSPLTMNPFFPWKGCVRSIAVLARTLCPSSDAIFARSPWLLLLLVAVRVFLPAVLCLLDWALLVRRAS